MVTICRYVELIVERKGGTIGDVTVTWKIDESNTNATRNSDYIADGATLNFAQGETVQGYHSVLTRSVFINYETRLNLDQTEYPLDYNKRVYIPNSVMR